MKTCNNCGAVVPDTANFCRECGSQLGAPVKRPDAIFPGSSGDYGNRRGPVEDDQGDATALIDSFEEYKEPARYEAGFDNGQNEVKQPAFEQAPHKPPFEQPAFEEPQQAAFEEPQKPAFQEPQQAPYKPPFEKPAFEEPQQQVFDESLQPEAPVYGGYAHPGGEASGGYRQAPSADRWDHTGEFDKKDISENKVVAMLVYLLGPVGIIIALLAANTSPYAGFHVRQGLKFVVTEILLGVITALMYPLIFPAIFSAINSYSVYGEASLGGVGFVSFLLIIVAIAWIILGILKIAAFFSICGGKAKEVALIRNLKFMR